MIYKTLIFSFSILVFSSCSDVGKEENEKVQQKINIDSLIENDPRFIGWKDNLIFDEDNLLGNFVILRDSVNNPGSRSSLAFATDPNNRTILERNCLLVLYDSSNIYLEHILYREKRAYKHFKINSIYPNGSLLEYTKIEIDSIEFNKRLTDSSLWGKWVE